MVGGLGLDHMQGESGNDRMFGNSGNDIIIGGDGDDFLLGQSGNDFLSGENGNDALNGGFGDDTILSGDGSDRVIGGAGDDNIRGDAGDDELFGNSGKDNISGGAGDDFIIGQSGEDTLSGGGGADVFVASAGQGIDTITDFQVGVGKIDLTALGFSSPAAALSRVFSQANGDAAIRVLKGQFNFNGVQSFQLSETDFLTDPADRLARPSAAGGGTPAPQGTAGADRLVGTAGADTLEGLAGDDVLTGAGGNDIINGGAGNDVMVHNLGDGEDVVDGGAGRDTVQINGSNTEGAAFDLAAANAGAVRFQGVNGVNSGAKCNTAGRFGICLMHNVKRCRHVELYASHAQRERSDRCLEGRWLKHPSHCGEA